MTLPPNGLHATLYAMSKQAALYIAVFATIALFIGWHWALYKGNAAELATRLRQIPNLRRGLFRCHIRRCALRGREEVARNGGTAGSQRASDSQQDAELGESP